MEQKSSYSGIEIQSPSKSIDIIPAISVGLVRSPAHKKKSLTWITTGHPGQCLAKKLIGDTKH